MAPSQASKLVVRAIHPVRLDAIRAAGEDGHGNRLRPFPAVGREEEPLRCCLRHALPGEQIALISHAPLEHPSVWREVGPVYIHAERREGFTSTGELPSELAKGPRVLRTYRPTR